MPAYPKHGTYYDSGFEWLGEIPEDWQTIRAKYVLREIDERSRTGDEELLSVSHLTGVTPRSEKNVNMFLAEDYTGAKLCQPDDVVINTMWAWMGALGVSPMEGLVSPSYGVYRPNEKVFPRFLDSLLRTPQYIAEYIRRSTGIHSSRLRLYPNQFLDIPLLLPPLNEQKRIVEFIDRKTSEIDQAIAQKQRIIELLQEQKAILINQAVTKGLNPNVQMRDSGITWIGRIPKHWNLPPMYARYRIELGKMLDSKKITGKYLVKYLRNTDVQWEKINITDLPEMDIEPSELERFLVRMGDLLVCEGGDIGRCAIWDIPDSRVGYQKALHRVRPFDLTQENIKYLFYVMQAASYNSVFFETAKPNTISHLTREMFKVYRFPQPPKNEQDLIVQHLESVDKLFDKALEVENKTIDSLNEMKSILIANAVTGKIKI